MSKNSDSALSIYPIVIASSMAISLANLGGSLRVLDITRSTVTLSFAVTLYNIFYTIMSWGWTGLFFGRVSRRNIIIISLADLFTGLILIALGNNVATVILGTVLVGTSSAVLSPLLMTMLIDYTGKDAVAVARYNLLSSIGLILGYLLGGVLVPSIGTGPVLTLTSFAIAALIPLALFTPRRYAVIEPRRITYLSFIPHFTGRLRPHPSTLFTPKIIYDTRKLVRDLVKMAEMKLARKLPLMLLSTSILFIGISVFFTPIPAFLRNLGFTDKEIYLTYLYSTVISSTSYIAIHKQAHKSMQAWKPLILSTTIRVPIFLLPLPLLYIHMQRVLDILVIELMFTLTGITWAYITTSISTLILSVCERGSEKDFLLGQLNASIGIGTITGSILSGIVYRNLNYTGILITASALVSISAVLYYKAWKTLIT